MLTSMWFMSLVTLLVVDVRIRALHQKDESARRCHHCAANATSCAGGAAVTTAQCSGDRPLCATSAASPNFTSELTCAAATKSPCSLTRAANDYVIVCTCTSDLCNTILTKDVQRQLLDFTTSNKTQSNSSDYTEAFFKLHFVNVTEEKLYKAVTVERAHATEKPSQRSHTERPGQKVHATTAAVAASTHMTISHPVEVGLPRAEAFKHEPTALSEDDEDASEGSGAYEETRTQRQPASDPADPSSFLPANENKAPPSAITFLLTTPMLVHLVA